MSLEQDFVNRRCSPGFAFNATRNTSHILSCKRRLCPECGKWWSWKWRQALAERTKLAEVSGLPVAKLALTLTLACDPGYERVQAVLRYFWQMLRKDYPDITYFGVVEYNQAHTQPHLHFLVADVDFIPWKKIKAVWIKAQQWGKLPRIAHIERIETIKGNIQQYFTKYITKLNDVKDEIPRRENWQGRYVRYSLKSKKRRGFFPSDVASILAAARFNHALTVSDGLDRLYFHVRKPYQAYELFMSAVSRETARLDKLVNRVWDYRDDFQRSDLFEPGDFQPSLPGFALI